MRLVCYNLENFFISKPKNISVSQAKPHPFEKAAEKCQAIADIILELDPDILMLTEVGGLSSLEFFNRDYLNNHYIPLLIPGNSERGIECAYLVKNNGPFQFKHLGHKQLRIDLELPDDAALTPHPTYGFSRDISELQVFKSRPTPIFCLMLVHLKSRRDDRKDDPNGTKRRTAEVEKLIEHAELRNKQWKHKVPIILTGDFNGIAQQQDHDPEFTPIYRSGLFTDVLEIAGKQLRERTTLYYFAPQEAKPNELQLDYIFVPDTLKPFVIPDETFVYRYRDKDGSPIQDPISENEISQYPSDHFPLVATFKQFY